MSDEVRREMADAMEPAPSTVGVLALFLVSAASSVGLAVVYWTGGQTQLEGALLAVALGGFGAAIILWANRFLASGPFEQARHEHAAPEAELAEVEADLERGGEVTRRRVLLTGFGTAAAALVGALVFPLRSLGPNPDPALRRTPWRKGMRAVNDAGRAVRADEVPIDSIATVFPDGFVGSADGQALLVRVDPKLVTGADAGQARATNGLLCFSKVCPHAGCPVGLYQAERHELLCPCHQSTFNVLRDAEPTFGPAARALPRLPITIDADGYVVALGDFPEPVGPTWWFR